MMRIIIFSAIGGVVAVGIRHFEVADTMLAGSIWYGFTVYGVSSAITRRRREKGKHEVDGEG